MLAYVCLLAFMGLAGCSEIEKVMPSRYEIESSINRTIDEVERMVRENPTLPKLSRGDIVNILFNITANDMSSIEDEALEALERTRSDYKRALMVVLPYKPEDSGESLKELYTKPPIVQMFADEASDDSRDSKIEFVYNSSHYSANNIPQSENFIENKHQLLTAHMRFQDSQSSESKPSSIKSIKDSEIVTTDKTYSSDIKTDSEPHKFSFNLESLDQKAEASHTSIATKRPIYKGTFSRYRTSTLAPKLEVVYSTTEKLKTTTETKVETTTAVPKKNNVLTMDQWQYYAPPTTTLSKTVKPDDSPWKPMSPTKDYFLPTIDSSEVINEDEANFSVLKMEDFQKVMETTTSTTERPSPIFVTPSSTSQIQKKIPTNNKIVPTSFKITTTTSVPTTTMRQEVEQLLKSIGLQPMKPTKSQNDFKFNKQSVEAQLNALFNSKAQGASKFEPIKIDSSSVKKENLFEAPSDVKDGVKNLSPDIQLLFQQFGLQMPGHEAFPTTTTTTPRPTTPTSFNSYTHFKPLPTSQVKDKDFRNFLARFGLGFGQSRNQKAMQPKEATKRPSLIEAVPDNMKKILENIGLIRKAPKLDQGPTQETAFYTETFKIIEHTTPINEHIFKPHEIHIDNKEQNEKIKNLLNTVKLVQEGRANVQDVQKVAHDLLQSTKSLANGPDPLKLEEILNSYRDNLKNEVKRQQEQTTTTTTTTTTEASPTTEELDETTLASMASTDSSAQPSELSETNASKTDQSSSSSDTQAASTKKPSFFDTFDVNAFLNMTDSTTTTAAPSGSTSKGSFFDTFNPDEFLKNEGASDGAKSNSGTSSGGDLEDSFGGSTPEPDPVLPTRPKTGLYFLVDWNSFLEVGEEGKDKVNLRFAPKVGDRTRFIPVKIP